MHRKGTIRENSPAQYFPSRSGVRPTGCLLYTSFSISLLYPVLSDHILPSSDIWGQTRCDIDISNLYALNYVWLCLSRGRPPCYRSCVVGKPLLLYQGVFSSFLFVISCFFPGLAGAAFDVTNNDKETVDTYGPRFLRRFSHGS